MHRWVLWRQRVYESGQVTKEPGKVIRQSRFPEGQQGTSQIVAAQRLAMGAMDAM